METYTWFILLTFEDQFETKWFHVHCSEEEGRAAAVDEAKDQVTGASLKNLKGIFAVRVDAMERVP